MTKQTKKEKTPLKHHIERKSKTSTKTTKRKRRNKKKKRRNKSEKRGNDLGGDATNIETSTTESPALLDAGGFKAKLSSLDGGDIASRAAADDDDVILIRSR